MRRLLGAAFVAALTASGCASGKLKHDGGDGRPSDQAGDGQAEPSGEAKGDGVPESSGDAPTDGAAEPAPDGPSVEPPDVAMEPPPEPAPEPASEPGPEPPDVPMDAATDAPMEPASDVSPDVLIDAPDDTPSDVPLDLPADLPPDEPPDLPTDLEPDFPNDVPPACMGSCRGGGSTLMVPGTCATPIIVPAMGGAYTAPLTGASAQTGACQAEIDGGEAVYQWTPSASGMVTFTTSSTDTTYHYLYVRTTTCAGAESACWYELLGDTRTMAVTSGTKYLIFVDAYNATYTGNVTLTILPPGATVCTAATAATDCGATRFCSNDGITSCTGDAACNRCAVGGVQNAKACTPGTVAADCGDMGTCGGTASGSCKAAADCNRCSNDATRACAVGTDCQGVCKAGSANLTVPGKCGAPIMVPPSGGTYTAPLTGAAAQSGSCQPETDGAEAVYQWKPVTTGSATLTTSSISGTYHHLYARTGTCTGPEPSCWYDALGDSHTMMVTSGTTYFVFVDAYNATYTGTVTLGITPPAALKCTTGSVGANCGTMGVCSQDGVTTCSADATCNRCTVKGVQNATPCTPGTVGADCGDSGTCGGTASGSCKAVADCNRCSNDVARPCGAATDCKGKCVGGSTVLGAPGSCAGPTVVPATGGTYTAPLTGASMQSGTCQGSIDGGEAVYQWTSGAFGTATLTTSAASGTYHHLYVRTGTCTGPEANCWYQALGGTRTMMVSSGSTYFVFVDAYDSSNTGTVSLTIGPANPATCGVGTVGSDCAAYTSPTCDLTGISCTTSNPCNDLPTCTTTNVCSGAPTCDLTGVSCTTTNPCNGIPTCATTNVCAAAPTCDFTGVTCP